VIIFKRIVRQVALKHGVYATFMAKPMENQPGSAMHLHISATDQQGNNLFGTPEGFTDAFRHFVGGLQRYLPEIVPLFAPNVNSFRRMRPAHSAPINVQWGWTTAVAGCACRRRTRPTPASKTVCPALIATPIWRSRPAWRRAGWGCSSASNRSA
jgi:hypothetical protein